MSFPEETPRPEVPDPSEEAAAGQEAFTESAGTYGIEEPILPEDFTPLNIPARLPRARRRRARRTLIPSGANERAALLDSLARRAVPSFEFFLFALLSGVILGIAYLLDSPALLLLGALLAPVLTPWVGLALATQIGSWRFFFLTLLGMIVACGLVFGAGVLAGMVGRLWLPLPLFHANIHAHLWWPDLFVVALGAVWLVTAFVHSEQKPIIPSVMLAYGLFLPLSAAGLGLGIGAEKIWPDGILVFLAHLTLAMLAGGIALAAMRFKPAKAIGCFLPFLIGLVSLATLVTLTGLATFIRDEITAARRIEATPTTLPLPSLTSTNVLRTSTPSTIPTLTFTPTDTLRPSATPQATPAYAVIAADPEYGGAYVRSEPGSGTPLDTLLNGSVVQVLPEVENVNGETWVRIRTVDNLEGWVLQSVLLATAMTPTPSSTLTP